MLSEAFEESKTILNAQSKHPYRPSNLSPVHPIVVLHGENRQQGQTFFICFAVADGQPRSCERLQPMAQAMRAEVNSVRELQKQPGSHSAG
jgi:hypothetical protein